MAAMTAAVTRLAAVNLMANGSSYGKMAVGDTGSHTSFASLKQIDTDLLNIGYAEDGSANGPVVILLHGWPYDIHSYLDVAPILAALGYRVISGGVGHNLPQEAPQVFADAVRDVDRES